MYMNCINNELYNVHVEKQRNISLYFYGISLYPYRQQRIQMCWIEWTLYVSVCDDPCQLWFFPLNFSFFLQSCSIAVDNLFFIIFFLSHLAFSLSLLDFLLTNRFVLPAYWFWSHSITILWNFCHTHIRNPRDWIHSYVSQLIDVPSKSHINGGGKG